MTCYDLDLKFQDFKLKIAQVKRRGVLTIRSPKFWISQVILFIVYWVIYLYAQSHSFWGFPLQYLLENITPILYVFGFSFFFISNFMTKILWSECDSWESCWKRTILIMTIMYFTYGKFLELLVIIDLDVLDFPPRMITVGLWAILGIPLIIIFTSVLCTITYISYPSSTQL